MTTPPATPTPGSQPTAAPAPAAPTPPTSPAAGRPAPAGTHQVAGTSSPLDTLVKGATDAAQQARAQVARAAENNRGRIAATVDKLGATIDQRTGGRYHQHVEKAKGWVESGIDAVTGTTHTGPGTSTTAGGTSTPTTAASSTTSPTPAAAAPTPPAKPAEGWHRGPNGEWVRS